VRYEARLNSIVEAATKVFAQKGFAATTGDDLIEATGLQRGGLYHYMSRKEDLLVEIHRRLIEPLLADAERIDMEPHDPATAVRLIAHALAHNLRDYHDEMVVFLHEWRTIRDDPAWEEIRRARRDLEHVIERALRRGVAHGSFEMPDTRLAALALLGMFNHAHQWFDPNGRVSADELADAFADIFLKGIQVRP
jgi:AcrR family transcriptional regulator